MEQDYLQQYKDYYKARPKRYEGNPKYKFSFEAECNLSDAMQSCAELIEFKDKIGNLNELCATALIKDKHLIEKEFYEKHKETIRVLASKRILEKADDTGDVNDLMTLVLDEMNINSVEISMDEFHREFQSEWSELDKIEIYENAEVPSKYKSDLQNTANEIKARVLEKNEELEIQGQKWDPSYRTIPELNKEHRHRRLIPYTDAHIDEQLTKYKSLINR